MTVLTGNSRIIYDTLRCMGEEYVSFGQLALMVGCHKNTVKNAIHAMAARGLIHYESARGKPNRYEFP